MTRSKLIKIFLHIPCVYVLLASFVLRANWVTLITTTVVPGWWKSSFVLFVIDITSELPFLIVLCTIDIHSELRRNPFREGGLTGLQRKPSEVALIEIQIIVGVYFRINIPN